MATIWDNLKNALGGAGSAWQETQKNMYTAPPANKTPAQTTATANKPITNPVIKDHNALASRQLGVPYTPGTTPTINQIVQQQAAKPAAGTTPVNTPAAGTNTSQSKNTSGTKVNTAPAVDSVYNAYAQAAAQQNQALLDRITNQYQTAIDSTNRQKNTALGNLDSQLSATLDLLEKQLQSSQADAQATKDQAVKLLESQLGMSKDQAQKQLDDAIARADRQKALMQAQRELQLKNTQQANAKAAENTMRDAYINYMLGLNYMPQQLKALGISGGVSETTAANMNNSYMNSRNAAALQKNRADRQARYTYDSGINQDALTYNDLVNGYNDNYYTALADAQALYNSGLLEAVNRFNTAMANASALYNSGALSANNNYYNNKYNLDNSIAQALIELQLARDTALANARQSQMTDYADLMSQYQKALAKAQTGVKAS